MVAQRARCRGQWSRRTCRRPLRGLAAIAAARIARRRSTPVTYVIRSGRRRGALAEGTSGITISDLARPAGRRDGAAWWLGRRCGVGRIGHGFPDDVITIGRTDANARRRPRGVRRRRRSASRCCWQWSGRRGAGGARPAEVEVDLHEALAAFIQQPVAAAQLEIDAGPPADAGARRGQADRRWPCVRAGRRAWALGAPDRAGRRADGLQLSSPPPLAELIAQPRTDRRTARPHGSSGRWRMTWSPTCRPSTSRPPS